MRKARDYEDIHEAISLGQKTVLLFTADWCGDCQYLYPLLEAIEAENSEFHFLQIDRDDFMDLAQKWDIFGIPSLIVIENGQEIGRFVDKNRKTKEEITTFLKGL
ncbi:thioredoxin family protein [Streptococcus hyovaginalis]|uniref:thioredoxin family protein n=1 Tax=Streptococcus hyovaginalis TaxID=149015 RepID=UPI00040E4852|nr:thioredoxin family protein [Streptococcus hyovaginalis]MDY4511774.1 thioredoxin family protein [Streptococcus hyovaginalis]